MNLLVCFVARGRLPVYREETFRIELEEALQLWNPFSAKFLRMIGAGWKERRSRSTRTHRSDARRQLLSNLTHQREEVFIRIAKKGHPQFVVSIAELLMEGRLSSRA